MLGDGFKTVFHCEHSDISGKCIEPDAKPVYCGVTYPFDYFGFAGKKAMTITTKREAFGYCPWVLFWDEYWEIAKAHALSGTHIPCFLYDEAANMPKADILEDHEAWEREYNDAILVVAERYHRRAIERVPLWFVNNNPHLVIPEREKHEP